ncbi:hypothetical protein D3H65_29315 [Paraflavitalea soli]|uniref:Uncharacterized protein n=1 Tax=Paraflavitalea soli TaxID=2315862 RepID=A0A3B7MUS1_9BACT|nr:hypothetical protein D3H65_29315 [Paraflavitalea soli]
MTGKLITAGAALTFIGRKITIFLFVGEARAPTLPDRPMVIALRRPTTCTDLACTVQVGVASGCNRGLHNRHRIKDMEAKFALGRKSPVQFGNFKA